MSTSWTLEQDIDAVVDACDVVWRNLSGSHLFITGGTGFIGCWLLETLCRANDRLGIETRATVLTRNPESFRRKAKHLAHHPSIRLITGDVSDFQADGDFTHLIHAATDASADLNENAPLRMFDTVLDGTRKALQFAVDRGIPKVLYLSSGAVYGNQPWELERVPETWMGGTELSRPQSNLCRSETRGRNVVCNLRQATWTGGADRTHFRVAGPLSFAGHSFCCR